MKLSHNQITIIFEQRRDPLTFLYGNTFTKRILLTFKIQSQTSTVVKFDYPCYKVHAAPFCPTFVNFTRDFLPVINREILLLFMGADVCQKLKTLRFSLRVTNLIIKIDFEYENFTVNRNLFETFYVENLLYYIAEVSSINDLSSVMYSHIRRNSKSIHSSNN